MSLIRLVDRQPLAWADAVVVGVAADRQDPVLVTDLLPGGADRLLCTLGATGEPEATTLAPVLPDGPVVLAVGLGPLPNAVSGFATDVLRDAAGAAVRRLAGRRRVLLALPCRGPAELAAIAEGALLGGYRFTRYRSASTVDIGPGELGVWMAEQPMWAEPTLRRSATVATAANWARDLVNTAPADLTPARMAEIACDTGQEFGLAVDVLDETALRDGGYGGIVGVGRGSAQPPRLVHLTHGGAGSGPRIALVGKGITFDAGGLSLKSAPGMAQMKMDMAGAAAVLAAVRALKELQSPVTVDAWLPLAENMPGPAALRPSDVLSMRNGLRVEIRDTDNEGRLVLADGLARACEEHPDLVVDVATLTSAQAVALGPRITGVMAGDDATRERVLVAARRAGEPMWGMPLPRHLRPRLDSAVADLANEVADATGAVEGGMLLAGLFLREFVPGDVAWAHLDIAGPAYNGGEPYGHTPHGGTGVAVRTLVQLVEMSESG